MNNKIPVIIIIVFNFLTQTHCSDLKKKGYLQIDPAVMNEISLSCPILSEKELIVYYFDAECGLCLAQASELENSVLNSTEKATLFIITSEIKDQVEFNIVRFGLKSCILVDSEISFNNEFLLNEKVTVDRSGRIKSYQEELKL